MKKPWTEAHVREGQARALELFAARVRAGGDLDKLDEEVEAAGFPDAWKPRSLLSYALGLNAAAMRRELRRVRALAEGRLVREPARWRVRVWAGTPATNYGPYDTREEGLKDTADLRARHTWRIVRVTRIRRAQ